MITSDPLLGTEVFSYMVSNIRTQTINVTNPKTDAGTD